MKSNQDNIKNMLVSKESNFRDLTSARKDIEGKLNNLNKQKQEISYKIKYLNDYIEQGGASSPSVKKVLSNPKLSGIHNTISNLVDTNSDYLLALTVALGGAKDYVVVNTPFDAKSAINYLKENNLGRVTFYPLNVIKPRYVDGIL